MTMENFKGTKGTWHVDDCGDVYDHNGFEIANMPCSFRIKEDWEKLGFQHWSDAKGESYVDAISEETFANAQLIAAAPELLMAMQDTMEILGKLTDANMKKYYSKVTIQYNKNLDIIKKALGE